MATEKNTILDYAPQLYAWEAGELNLQETIDLFQYLVDEGHCWRLQGFYGRTAMDLLQAGLVFYRDAEGAFIKKGHPDYKYSDFYTPEEAAWLADSLGFDCCEDCDDDDDACEETNDDSNQLELPNLTPVPQKPFVPIVGEGEE